MSLDRPPIAEEFRNAAEHSPSRAATSGKSAPPFSLRLSAAERAELLRRAGSRPLGAYIRSCLLDGAESPRRAHRQPVKDEQALARVLGELGKAKLANNLNQLAKAANLGSLSVGPETEQAIVEACQEIRRMRETLMVALGLRW
ncbi:plasmid mobilization relaxosome protein MobC [Eoetvoesiella caeni]|uniref:Mobilization protein MobC n=1 Tax=Eoetvoesiella caeni TaxID=645616 RepID=A0A366HEA3_9BURK|nr:plasmid mobilization relaxosome protein MobC [Eoetvoesiella caeni]MCI2808941.1 MobC family plasmid mobilization relaxosome protein [Eoetvoesiella caeni]NYT55558.1 plasmid mobilization relaxosome protein MobC [Eoetvoesiella caeni]RBP40112.1 mobilization protein MobC [Eoetvoesiella caeni]